MRNFQRSNGSASTHANIFEYYTEKITTISKSNVTKSKLEPVLGGVPPGYVLGPLLFYIYLINSSSVDFSIVSIKYVIINNIGLELYIAILKIKIKTTVS